MQPSWEEDERRIRQLKGDDQNPLTMSPSLTVSPAPLILLSASPLYIYACQCTQRRHFVGCTLKEGTQAFGVKTQSISGGLLELPGIFEEDENRQFDPSMIDLVAGCITFYPCSLSSW